MVNGVSYGGIYQSGATEAQEKPRGFARVDTNGDGKIDSNELEVMLSKFSQRTGVTLNAQDVMKQFDQDGDGSLSPDEAKKMMKSLREEFKPQGGAEGGRGMRAFKKADANGDGELSTDELTALLDRISKKTGQSYNAADLIKEFDQNGDGSLNPDETKAMMKSILGGRGHGQNGQETQDQGSPGLAAYNQTGNDNVSLLINILTQSGENQTNDATTQLTSFLINYKGYNEVG